MHDRVQRHYSIGMRNYVGLVGVFKDKIHLKICSCYDIERLIYIFLLKCCADFILDL